MSSQWFQFVVQAISTLGAAGGLLYAGKQLRGWRTSQYIANFTKLVELQLQLRKMLMDDPAMAFRSDGLPAQTPLENIRGSYYHLMQLSLFEIAWFTHLHGQLTQDYFNAWAVCMAEIVKQPAFQTMWRDEQFKILHSGFRDYVNDMMK